MERAQQLHGIAAWLCADAQRRKQKRRARGGWWIFTEQFPTGRALSNDNDGPSGPLFASASIHPRKNWVLLELFNPELNAAVELCRLHVIAYFGRARGGDVHGSAGKQRKRLEFREAFRSMAEKGWTAEVMYIDSRTQKAHIVEQLAAFCLRRGIDPDGSLGRLMGFASRDANRRRTAEHLVRKFVDPLRPQSYPAYRRIVQQRILSSG